MTSYRLSIDPKSRKVGRFLGSVRREIIKAFAEEKSSRNLSQADIARELGVHRSVINRQLMGTENMTLRRVGEFAWALGRELQFSLVKPADRAGANQLHDRKVNVPSATTTMTTTVTATAAFRGDDGSKDKDSANGFFRAA